MPLLNLTHIKEKKDRRNKKRNILKQRPIAIISNNFSQTQLSRPAFSEHGTLKTMREDRPVVSQKSRS